MLIAFHFFQLIGFDDQMPLVADPLEGIILDSDILIALGVDENLLAVLGVFQPDLVETGASFAGIALERGHGRLGRQAVGRHVDTVIDPASNDGLIGVTFQEIHDHFLADARDIHRSPLLTRPHLRNSNPAGTVLIGLTVAVPVKLAFHPTVLIGIDFLATRPHHGGSLRSLHHRFRGGA